MSSIAAKAERLIAVAETRAQKLAIIQAAIEEANHFATLEEAQQDLELRIKKYEERGTNRFGQGYIAAMKTCLIQLRHGDFKKYENKTKSSNTKNRTSPHP